MKEKYTHIEDNLIIDRENNIGQLKYYYSPSKMNVCFTFPLEDDGTIKKQIVRTLSKQFFEKTMC